jgi:uncharacterized protein (DUF2344 family)
MRVFARAFRRGNIPISFSKGFNPHANMIFGLPLPVGVTSECEYLDVSLAPDKQEPEFIIDTLLGSLNAQLPAGIAVLEAKLRDNKTNIMSQITHAEYLVTLTLAPCDDVCAESAKNTCVLEDNNATQVTNGSCEDILTAGITDKKATNSVVHIKSRIDHFLKSEAYPVKKTSKKGIVEVDIRPLVKKLELFSQDAPGKICLKMTLCAGSKGNLNPRLLLSNLGVDDDDGHFQTAAIHRTGLFIKDASE